MVKLKVCSADSAPLGDPDESVTLKVMAVVLPAVGVPKSTPALFKVIPAGRVPLATVQIKGCTPPLAVKAVW
jgi:hypothetical protein